MKLTRNARSAIFAICAVGLMFSACNGDAANTTDPETEEVKDNLPQSKGENELAGKTYASDEYNVSFEFASDSVKMTSLAATNSEANMRSAESDSTGTLFNYAFNSEDKELYFQINSILQSDGASDYKKELAELKENYGSVKNVLVQVLEEGSLASVFEAAKTAGINVMQSYIQNKVQAYFNDQMSALTSYLTAKFNSVMTLGYTLNDKTLNLEQKFEYDLTDASSEFNFLGEDFSIVLNDYENLEPFNITIPGETEGSSEREFIGVPKITKKDELTGTISVELYSELAQMKNDPNAIQQIVTSKVEDVMQVVQELLTGDNLLKIAAQFGLYGSSEILDDALDQILASHTFECTYTIETVDDEPVLKIKNTKVPTELEECVPYNEEIILDYNPVIKYELTKVSETE